MTENIERTLSIIKPDAIKANYSGKIIDLIESKGFFILAQKRITLSAMQAEVFYNIHRDRPFFSDLVSFMTSASISVQVLEKENAVNSYRLLMGATDSKLAEEGTIRKLYGSDIQNNAVHGSDSLENAEVEIKFFFSGLELLSKT
tara:strand:- start:244 stop:678 length:435 start_codon:yes stop_codon:yes gene_type:complete